MIRVIIRLVALSGVLGLTPEFFIVHFDAPIVTAKPAVFSRGGPTREAQQEKPAEQVFKNIQVFKGLPASHLRPAMSFMAASLGVTCENCHTNPWDSDAKPAKQTARQMIVMMRDINRENFAGSTVVTCATCHRGQPTPRSLPPLGQLTEPRSNAVRADVKTDAPLPAVDQIFDNYVAALGGKAALDKLETRIVRASEISSDGSRSTVEIYAKAPNKLLTITTASPPAKSLYVQGFTGASAWAQFNNGKVTELSGVDLIQVTRDAEFHKGLSYFRAEYADITVKGKERIDGRDVYVIQGMNSEALREWLFFDVQTGLLARRYGELQTVLGRIPFQADYSDYRKVDGGTLPFVTRWSLLGSSWTDTYTEVKHNLPIDDAKFRRPAPPGGKLIHRFRPPRFAQSKEKAEARDVIARSACSGFDLTALLTRRSGDQQHHIYSVRYDAFRLTRQ